MKLSFCTLDVFTSIRYLGNPVAIIQVPSHQKDSLSQSQKQAIAREFNLSEIVFMHESSGAEVPIDIFTSHAEIPFAGHPTIGSAFHLLSKGSSSTAATSASSSPSQPITALLTKAGRIPVSFGLDSYITASIPHNIHIHALTLPSPLATGQAQQQQQQNHPVVSIVKGMTFVYVPLPDLAALSKAATNVYADMYDPARLDPGWQAGLVGTMYYVEDDAPSGDAPTNERRRYRTRMFGSREDPATGSASSGLAAFLALGEERQDGRFEYAFTQGVEMGKESEIGVVIGKEGGKVVSVGLRGTAVQVMEGTLEV